jgi:hypothetical protein
VLAKAFNVRMVSPGGCSLRACDFSENAEIYPTGALANFSAFSWSQYPVQCPAAPPPTPAPPLPPLPPLPVSVPGASFSVVKESTIGPLLSRQNVTVDAASGVTQAFNYTVIGDTGDVDFLYTFMTMFANSTATWVAGTNSRTEPEYR